MKTRLLTTRVARLGGFTLPELMTTLIILSVVMLVGMGTLQMIWSETRKGRQTVNAQRTCFGVLQRLEQDIKRSTSFQFPDPGNPDAAARDSILVTVPSGAGSLRRAFRIDANNNFIIDLRDEGVAPFTAFTGVTDLTYEWVTAATTMKLTCTTVENGQNLTMQTVVFKRN